MQTDRQTDLHINHIREPRERYCDSEDQPDIAITDPETGCEVELDVSLAHPWCVDILSKATREDGAAAARREEKKVKKYQSKVLPGGLSLNFVPLVMEHFGRWDILTYPNYARISTLITAHKILSATGEEDLL